MSRFTVIEVDAWEQATVIGTIDRLEDAPHSNGEATVYVIKTFQFAPSEVWVRHPENGEWLRHSTGHPMLHI